MTHPRRRDALAGALALAATPVLAQAAAPRILIQTALGDITLELAADKAPVTAANFLRYVDAKRFDGASFYRALKLVPSPLAGLVQGGVLNDPAKSFPAIAHESTKATGLSHTDGAVSMARYDPGTATSEFFICVGDLVSLNATAEDPGYAVFGRVIQGMDVVRKILLSPVSAKSSTPRPACLS